MRHRPYAVAAIAAVAAAGSAGISIGAAQHVDRAHVDGARGAKVIVTGCRAEDACRIDYRGNGHWVITRQGDR